MTKACLSAFLMIDGRDMMTSGIILFLLFLLRVQTLHHTSLTVITVYVESRTVILKLLKRPLN